MKLPFLSGKKFIITIGDDGAVLTFFNKNNLIAKFFASSHEAKDRREINAILLKNPSVPIRILLDGAEQNYVKQLLPAISPFSIGKLVKKRLERDFTKTDIKGAVFRGREASGRKDWQYMFVSTPATPALLEWFDYFATLQNPITTIALLPLEMENVASAINKVIFEKGQEKQGWQFIVTHNKASGFRQTILDEDRVVFTRLIRQGRDNLPDIVAGNIEQEIINTLDYLRRIGLTDEKIVDIIIISSSEIKTSLATTKIRGRPLMMFTPFEISKKLGYGNISEKDSKFADVIISRISINYRPILKLANPRSKGVDLFLLFYNAAKMLVIIAAPLSIIYSGILGSDIVGVYKKIQLIENQKARIEKQWKDVKNNGKYGIEEANKITDAMSIRKKLLDEQTTPLDMLGRIANINFDFILLESLTWNFAKDYAVAGKKGQINAILNLNFLIKDGGIEVMFRNYDILVSELQSKLKDFQIDISKLPDKITFDNNNQVISLQVKLTSKEQPASKVSVTNGDM